MASKSKIIAELFEADGDIIASALDNVVVTPTAISDQVNTSTGGLSMPTGTTAQRPSSPDTGESRMNTTTGSLEFYDGSVWVSTNLIPLINSVTGNIVTAIATQLVFSLSNNTDSVDIVFSEGGSVFHTMTGQSVSSGALTITVPSQVYGQTAGDTISVSVNNSDGTPSSNAINKTVIAPPSGGTVATSGSYRYHTFTSSGTFTNTVSGLGVEYLIVAGGGGSTGSGPTGTYPQAWSGGGGAGGLLQSSTTPSVTSHSVTVGAAGAIDGQGGNSSVFSITATGGGIGGYYSQNGGSGGSGGGGGGDTTTSGGSGIAGQGNAGGAGYDPGPEGGGGGGGAGGVGAEGRTGGTGNGGAGRNFSTWATATSTGDNGSYASGGGGGPGTVTSSLTSDIDGGGGRGAAGAYNSGSNNAENGAANTGGGGGGGNRSGGSGIVILRYQL